MIKLWASISLSIDLLWVLLFLVLVFVIYFWFVCLFFFFFSPFHFFYPMLSVFLDCPFIDFTGMSRINGNRALNLNAPFPKGHAQWIKQEMYSDVNLHINILPSFMTYTPLFCSTTIRFPHFYHSWVSLNTWYSD